MKTAYDAPNRQRHQASPCKGITIGIALALSFGLLQHKAEAALLAVDLSSAADFAILAGGGITIAAPVNSTEIDGDIGTHATTSITGTENLILHGGNHGGNATTQQAKIDLGDAYTDAAERPVDVTFPLIHDIGGLSLVSGVYNAPSSLSVNGVLTLDGGGDPDAVWIFQIGSTLVTATGSSVNLINGARASNVFWQVGSSATLGVDSQFAGSILAQESITLNTGADLVGQALARVGEVTLDNNNITIPETGSSVLCALGLSLALLSRRKR